MKNTARFLLGGVLGMVVGYLLAQKGRKGPAADKAATQESTAAEAPQVEAVPSADLPEVVVAPDVLEEPLPGSGWEPASSLAVEEEVIEEVLPVVPDLSTSEERPVSEREPVEEEAVEDLRTRIEATRRRIRKELEQPFAPLPSEHPVPERSASEPVEDSVEFTLDEIPGASRERVDVDYESVRRRIEQVRSRLKAKAFDAMMSGEATLLGRDSGRPPTDKHPVGPVVDADIDQTIETTLREEEI